MFLASAWALCPSALRLVTLMAVARLNGLLRRLLDVLGERLTDVDDGLESTLVVSSDVSLVAGSWLNQFALPWHRGFQQLLVQMA